jgi:hypothetical protein
VRWATAGTLDGDEVTRLRALLGTFGVEGE